MKNKYLLIAVMAATLLVACGRKGPLFIPDDQPGQEQAKKDSKNKKSTESK